MSNAQAKASKPTAIRAFGAFTDPGPSRQLNEDAYLVVPEHQLFAVADGFGGKGAGDVAAKKTLEAVKFFVENGLGDSEITLPFVYRRYYTSAGNLLFNAFLYANEQLCNENSKVHINGRGGTSLLVCIFDGNHVTIANAGACDALLVRRGRVQQLIKPRSYNAVRGTFQGSWNSKWAFPMMALGCSKDLEPEIMDFQAERGDLLILASDGVYPRLSEEDFSECFSLLNKRNALDLAIKQQNQRFIELAQAKGNTDNQALISIVCA